MAITRRKDGRAEKKLMYNGKPKHFYSNKKSDIAAEREINRKILEFKEKQKSTHLFPQVADRWLDNYLLNVPYHNYKKDLRAKYNYLIERFKNTYIEDILPADVDQMLHELKDKKYKKKTVAGYKSALSLIMAYATVKEKILTHNPVTEVKLPHGLQSSKRSTPEDEALAVVASHYEGFDLLPYFLLYTGCRRSEALAIKQKDLDFDKKIIKIRYHLIHDDSVPIYEPVLKTDAAYRNIIMLDRLAEVLPRKFDGFLFSVNGDGKEPFDESAYQAQWNDYCARYDISITAHQLRHGYATLLYEAGIGDKDAQDLMGHADIHTTRQTYTDIRKMRKNSVAEQLNNYDFFPDDR